MLSALHRPRIVIVNDDPVLRDLLARLLGCAGYEVVEAKNGEADFAELSHAVPAADLVLVNSYLPHLNGNEIVARVAGFFPCCAVMHVDQGGVPFRPERLMDVVGEAYRPRHPAAAD